MLVITRKVGERILINDNIVVEILEILSYKKIKIGITAPKEVSVVREENYGHQRGNYDDDFNVD